MSFWEEHYASWIRLYIVHTIQSGVWAGTDGYFEVGSFKQIIYSEDTVDAYHNTRTAASPRLENP